jgi:hypothetical protein
MHCSFSTFTLILNCLPLTQTTGLESLLGTSETSLCSMSAPKGRTALLDALQLLTLFAGALRYLEPKLFILIIFYSGSSCVLKY